MIPILHVAIPCPLRLIFDYFDNEIMTSAVGMRVLVPFGSRQLVGIIVGKSTKQESDNLDNLKEIIKLIDNKPLIPTSIFELIQWVSDYYHHPIGDCFQTALPKKLRFDEPAELQTETLWKLNKQNNNLKLGKKQGQILDCLKVNPEGLSQKKLTALLGQCRSSLLSLHKKQLVVPTQTVLLPLGQNQNKVKQCLSKQQQFAVDTVWQQKNTFERFLLNGITGSGKTEVYIHLAQKYIAEGKQVLVLIPEISLTTQFVERFCQQLTATIVVMNSSISDQDRKQAWLLAKEGIADVIIGTRSAIFTPIKNLGFIVVDEEHDNSYKQQDGLRYHARSVALIRAKKANIPILLGSATPSLESLYNVEQGRFKQLNLTERATGAFLPKVRIVDSKGPAAKSGLSSILYQAIEKQIALGNQVLLFINRRGFAPVLMCHYCGWQASCTSCDAKMIVHQSRNILMCHHCGLIYRLVHSCPECKNSELATYGVGTQQLEKALQHYFPNVPVIRIDRDSTQKVNAFADIVDEIKQDGAKLLVGTQMLAKGHDFHNVTLVGVLDADQGLFSADFRATESLAQLITQVTGRAGRGEKTGEVFIQTSQPKHEFWQDLIGQGYNYIAQKLLQQRKQMAMPPTGSLCVVRAEEKQQTLAMQFLTDVAAVFSQTDQQDVMVLGPVPAMMEKRAGRYRAQLLLSSPQRKPIHQLLDKSIDVISKLKLARKVRWSIDIDPIDLM